MSIIPPAAEEQEERLVDEDKEEGSATRTKLPSVRVLRLVPMLCCTSGCMGGRLCVLTLIGCLRPLRFVVGAFCGFVGGVILMAVSAMIASGTELIP